MALRIAAVVREKRRSKGLTQEELAELAGVSSGYIGQLERAELTPSLSVVAVLIDILAIDANTLFFEDSKSSISNEIALRSSRLPKESQELILGLIEVVERMVRKGRK